MPVTRCLLNGRFIQSLEDLYDELSRCLRFPEYFGRNLDALYDVLSTDVEGPFEIVWEQADASKRGMGGDFEKVVALLRDLEAERSDFKISYL